MNKCADEYCKFKAFENDKYCIFHCDKTAWILGDVRTELGTIPYFNKEWDTKKVECFWKQLDRYIKYIIKLENRESKKYSRRVSVSIRDNHPFNFLKEVSIARIFSSTSGEPNINIYIQNIKFPAPLTSSVASKVFEIKEEFVKILYLGLD